MSAGAEDQERRDHDATTATATATAPSAAVHHGAGPCCGHAGVEERMALSGQSSAATDLPTPSNAYQPPADADAVAEAHQCDAVSTTHRAGDVLLLVSIL
ncbi:uncharacterized protein PV09_06803 [Verruconis gallopava]|uniref:Uncharacterized protein n=1 Tax=Verruconis gallopava TaxID=253628 RepID=A0A0D1YMG2_9PEZI|nr:uncharacterized protein PV09_06803 [Verruconis gallopava]KIW01967.1 hypothetical protein PV09_06803 [Verruconis gallopava]